MRLQNFTIIQSQKDSRWGNEDMRNGVKIKDYGCLLTCISMTVNYYGVSETPLGVVNKLNRVNGITYNGSYYWKKSELIYQDIDLHERYKRTNYLLKDRDIDTIKSAIDRGFPVMVWLDYNPKTSKSDMHWVLIIGYDPNDENNFTIIDPIDGKEKSLKKYLGWFKKNARRTIEAYVIYEGKHLSNGCENCVKYKNKLKKIEKDNKNYFKKINDVIKILKN